MHLVKILSALSRIRREHNKMVLRPQELYCTSISGALLSFPREVWEQTRLLGIHIHF
jgi:hypothetical protein